MICWKTERNCQSRTNCLFIFVDTDLPTAAQHQAKLKKDIIDAKGCDLLRNSNRNSAASEKNPG